MTKMLTRPLLAAVLPLCLALAVTALRPAHAGRRARATAQAAEPTLEQVRRAALHYAGLAERPDRAWSRRTRLAGLLPVVTVRVVHDTHRDEELSRSSTGAQRLDLSDDQDTTLEARAVWRLDRLVFDESELRAAQASWRLHHERLALLAQVTSLYFQRRKLQLTAPATDPGRSALEQLALAELTAQLDALTGGYFSAHLGPDKP